jgi:hypothetical protein
MKPHSLTKYSYYIACLSAIAAVVVRLLELFLRDFVVPFSAHGMIAFSGLLFLWAIASGIYAQGSAGKE